MFLSHSFVICTFLWALFCSLSAIHLCKRDLWVFESHLSQLFSAWSVVTSLKSLLLSPGWTGADWAGYDNVWLRLWLWAKLPVSRAQADTGPDDKARPTPLMDTENTMHPSSHSVNNKQWIGTDTAIKGLKLKMSFITWMIHISSQGIFDFPPKSWLHL